MRLWMVDDTLDYLLMPLPLSALPCNCGCGRLWAVGVCSVFFLTAAGNNYLTARNCGFIDSYSISTILSLPVLNNLLRYGYLILCSNKSAPTCIIYLYVLISSALFISIFSANRTQSSDCNLLNFFSFGAFVSVVALLVTFITSE